MEFQNCKNPTQLCVHAVVMVRADWECHFFQKNKIKLPNVLVKNSTKKHLQKLHYFGLGNLPFL